MIEQLLLHFILGGIGGLLLLNIKSLLSNKDNESLDNF